jgi:hypothetical protein
MHKEGEGLGIAKISNRRNSYPKALTPRATGIEIARIGNRRD